VSENSTLTMQSNRTKISRFIVALLLAMSSASWSWPFGASGVKAPPFAAPEAAFSSQSRQFSLAQFKGHKVMLWLFSTWCSTCIPGLKALVVNQPQWKQKGLVILALKNFKNGGYPGPSVDEFAARFGAPVLQAPNWIFGDASAEMDARYNARKFPDIYFLIDEQSVVQVVSTAPAVTLDKIMKFAGGD